MDSRTPGEVSLSALRQLGLSESSERLFFSLTARAPVGVFATGVDGSCVYVNDRLCELTGRTFEQSLGDGWTRAIHPDDADWVKAGWAAALAAGSDFEPEHRFQRPDGTVVWVRGFAAAVRDAEDRLAGWIGVCVEDTERRQSEAALREARERAERLVETSNEAERSARHSLELLEIADQERRRLLARIVRAQEEERRRIAGDLHDESVQTLTALAIRLDVLSARIDDPELVQQLVEIKATARSAISTLRQLMFELHPPVLDRDGLAAALLPHLEQLRLEPGLEVELEDALGEELAPETAAAAYRIVQEALLNIRKHAGARRVDVKLAGRADGLHVSVSDDGRGFETGGRQEPGHLGLSAMRERVEMAGGWIRIDSEPGRGTTVEFTLPPGQKGSPR